MPRVEYTQATGLVQKQSLKDGSGNLLSELDLQGSLFGYRSKIKSVTGATQLLASESGSTILITPGNADYAITLPDLDAKFYDEAFKEKAVCEEIYGGYMDECENHHVDSLRIKVI